MPLDISVTQGEIPIQAVVHHIDHKNIQYLSIDCGAKYASVLTGGVDGEYLSVDLYADNETMYIDTAKAGIPTQVRLLLHDGKWTAFAQGSRYTFYVTLICSDFAEEELNEIIWEFGDEEGVEFVREDIADALPY